MRLGRRAHQSYLPACAIRAIARSTRAEEAICAVVASILAAAYHMLKDGTFYEDLGAVHFDRRRPETQARRLVKRLAELGFSVELKPAAAVS
jgi:transposase